ncbi:MAG TPA: sensor histidine kinase [Bryobacteraceae bacterium]
MPVVTGLLTTEGKRHVRRMLRSLEPRMERLERSFDAWLRRNGCDEAVAKALLAVTPAAAARFGSLRPFLKQVEYSGRRLAKLNLPPAVVSESLQQFNQAAGEALEGQFAPAREQLQLATHYVIQQAYYEVREAESQAFFGLFRAETEAADLNDLLGRFVRVLTKALRAAGGRLLLEEHPPGELGAPLYIERGDANERLIDRGWRRKYASYWSYPFGQSAVLQLGFATLYPWLPRERALLAAAAARCQEAMDRTRMAEQIRRLQAESLRTEEEERKRIGRDLHDEAGQALAFLRLQLEMIERDAPERIRPRLTAARELAGRTTVELRRIIAALSPSVLERLGLQAALRLLVNRFHYNHAGVEVEHRVSVLPETVPRAAQEVIYRAAQEALGNAGKHSGAKKIKISLTHADKKIRLRVRDDGAGFRQDRALLKPGSFGLAGMRERAALLGGTLAIRTAPGKGTEVRLDLPVPVISNGKNSRLVN